MDGAKLFLRVFLSIINAVFITALFLARTDHSKVENFFLGLLLSAVFSAVLFAIDIGLKRVKLKAFNTILLGIFLGCLLGQGVVMIFDKIIDFTSIPIELRPFSLELIKTSLFLFSVYLGTTITWRSSHELHLSIPFLKLENEQESKREFIMDASACLDPRIIDLASSGILDSQIVVPRFLVKEFYAELETENEQTKSRAKTCLENIKKLEQMPFLNLRFETTDFSEITDINQRIIRLGRLLDSYILSADINRVKMAAIEGIRIINLHVLSNALKPLNENGELLKIKIQRYGKESNQGVGYLEDGTMVVVNGGGDFIGEIIDAQVLSVKHTNSGRMIFCNALEDGSFEAQEQHELIHNEH